MRQRVMIAMALACNPPLVIADEPTTALDVMTQAQILNLLAQLREERNLALIVITHDLSVLAQVTDRVAVMYAGRIVEEGSAAELLTAPRHPYTQIPGRRLPRRRGPRLPRRPCGPARRPAPPRGQAPGLRLSSPLSLRIRALRQDRSGPRKARLAPGRLPPRREGGGGGLTEGGQKETRADTPPRSR